MYEDNIIFYCRLINIKSLTVHKGVHTYQQHLRTMQLTPTQREAF